MGGSFLRCVDGNMREAGQSIGVRWCPAWLVEGCWLGLAGYAAADESGCASQAGAKEQEGAGLRGDAGNGAGGICRYAGGLNGKVQGSLGLVEVDEKQSERVVSCLNCRRGAWNRACGVDSAVAADEIPVDKNESHIVGADRKVQHLSRRCVDRACQGGCLISVTRRRAVTGSSAVRCKKSVVAKRKRGGSARCFGYVFVGGRIPVGDFTVG
jgi:hypothetical protein